MAYKIPFWYFMLQLICAVLPTCFELKEFGLKKKITSKLQMIIK